MLSEGYHERAIPPHGAFTGRVQSAGKGITMKRRAEGNYFCGMRLLPNTTTAKSLSSFAVIRGGNDGK